MSFTFKIKDKDLIVHDSITGEEVVLLDTGTEYKSMKMNELKTYIISATYIKTTEPTVNDDDINGYKVGDKGYDNVGKEVYILIDNTTGNANGQNTTLDISDLEILFDEKADKTITDGMFGIYDNGSQSGDVILTPSNGYKQESVITGNITSLICNLTLTYPDIIGDITTNGLYTINLTGWETPYGDPIYLPDTGKCQILLSLGSNGVSKVAALTMTEVE